MITIITKYINVSYYYINIKIMTVVFKKNLQIDKQI